MTDTRNNLLYCRLSRADLEAPGKTEEKFERYIKDGQELAKRHGDIIAPENILIEQQSAGKLANRPVMQDILARARAGDIRRLYCYDWDRVFRGDKRDEADIEDALCLGNVTVITNVETLPFSDDYDSLSVDVRSLLARQERRKYIRRLRDASLRKAREGKRSGGVAAYGYLWTKPRYEGRDLVDPAHYEIVGELTLADEAAALTYAQEHAPECLMGVTLNSSLYLALARRQALPGGSLLPGVACINGEYHILCEIFQRIRTESLRQITLDLTRRFQESGEAAPPGAMRRADASERWHRSALRSLLLNPFYAGFPGIRSRIRRDGKQRPLPRDEWVLADDEQTFPHPVALHDQERIAELLTARTIRGEARPSADALLTGLLYCPLGRPMTRVGVYYRCCCRLDYDVKEHSAQNVHRERFETVAVTVLEQALSALPAELTEDYRSRKHARARAAAEIATLRRNLTAKRHHKEFLMTNVADLMTAWTKEQYAVHFAETETAIQDMETRERELDILLRQPDEEEIVSLAREVARIGFHTWWEALDPALKRLALRAVIARMEPIPPPRSRAWIRAVRITVQDHIARYYQPPDPFPLPITCQPEKNLGAHYRPRK